MDPWKRWRGVSPREIRRRQDRMLARFVREELYPFSPFYRDLFDRRGIRPERIRGLDDLRRIPFTTKTDLVDPARPEAFRRFILRPSSGARGGWTTLRRRIDVAASFVRGGDARVRETLSREFRPIFMTFTTGTTETPVPFVYTDHDIRNLALAGQRLLSVFAIPIEARILNMFPYAAHLAYWQVAWAGFASGVLVLGTGGGKTIGTEGNLRAIERMRPEVIIGVPSYVYHVLRTAVEQGRRFPGIAKVILGAARADPAAKRRIRALLSRLGSEESVVLGTYGFTEARMAWGECPAEGEVSSGYHLYPDLGLFEVIDPDTGEPRGEGEDGELVYTALDGRGSCVLRYRTGDHVVGGMTFAPCPHCGLSVPRISTEISRLSDRRTLRLSKLKGTLVDFDHFHGIFAGIPQIEEWQIELRKKSDDPFEIDELVVYCSLAPGAVRETALDRLRGDLRSCLEVSPNEVVVLEHAEMIRRLELETANKERRIIDRRPEEG